jgi:hypothetical protein
VGENVEYYQSGGAAGAMQNERPREETAGIPTGVSPDLAAAIERKRKRQPSPPSPQPARRIASSRQAQPLQTVALPVQGIGQQQGIPLIKSLDDPAFAALPSGAPFVTPDGETRWKK